MKADFRRFPVYTGIRKDRTVEADISESLADLVYRRVPGLPAHVLAEKIYTSQDGTELDGRERDILLQLADQLTGVYCDSIKDYFKKQEKK